MYLYRVSAGWLEGIIGVQAARCQPDDVAEVDAAWAMCELDSARVSHVHPSDLCLPPFAHAALPIHGPASGRLALQFPR